MVFNVLAANHDDHGKNHAFLYDETARTWSLTPAYELTFTMGGLERSVLVSGEVWPSRATMQALCIDAGVSKGDFETLFEEVGTTVSQWPDFASQAEVPKAKTQEVHERLRHIRARVDGH